MSANPRRLCAYRAALPLLLLLLPLCAGAEAFCLARGIPDGGTVRLEAGGKALDVRVMQSSSVPSLFITTQSGTLSFIHEKKTSKEPGAYALLSADGEPLAQGALEHVKARGICGGTYFPRPLCNVSLHFALGRRPCR